MYRCLQNPLFATRVKYSCLGCGNYSNTSAIRSLLGVTVAARNVSKLTGLQAEFPKVGTSRNESSTVKMLQSTAGADKLGGAPVRADSCFLNDNKTTTKHRGYRRTVKSESRIASQPWLPNTQFASLWVWICKVLHHDLQKWAPMFIPGKYVVSKSHVKCNVEMLWAEFFSLHVSSFNPVVFLGVLCTLFFSPRMGMTAILRKGQSEWAITHWQEHVLGTQKIPGSILSNS